MVDLFKKFMGFIIPFLFSEQKQGIIDFKYSS